MNQLDYIKSQFTNHSLVVDFLYAKDDSSLRYVDLQNTLKETNELIKDSDNIESVMSHIKEARRRFLLHWDYVVANKEFNPIVYEKMKEVFFSSNLNNPEEWLQKTKNSFEQKQNNGFLVALNKGVALIGKKFPKPVVSDEKIEKYSLELMEKYKLNHINLTNISSYECMDFLTNLDVNLKKVCSSMGIADDVIGIHRTIGFSASPHSEAFYSSEIKSITVGGLMQDCSTLLHEWVHALDFYVGDYIVPNTFASHIEHSVHIDNSAMYQAFQSMKTLTHEIFNSSSSFPFIEPLKKELFKEGTSQFFSELIGYDFYTLPENIKQNLHSEKSFEIINNYLAMPDVKSTQQPLLEFIQSNNLQSDIIIDKIKSSTPDLLYLKPYFDDVNQNLWSNKSFYYMSSKLSMLGLKINNLIVKFADKGFNNFSNDKVAPTEGNVNDNDYLTQPREMVARYFESQVFPHKALANNIASIFSGIYSYKIGVDKSFENNKNNIIENVFGKDKVLKNISSIRQNLQQETTLKLQP